VNLRIGSRGSQLALWQANHIAQLLGAKGHAVEIEVIKTTGDRLQESAFVQAGSKGIFTKEIEEALAEGRIDLAVHSLKDLPTELAEAFTLAAIPRREDPRDAFVAVKCSHLAGLHRGAKIGTSSLRRRAQLKAVRPDIEVVEFRGNVETRLRKLAEGQVDAIVLAAAGLKRLGKTEFLRERLSTTEFCPAAGQGALGIESRKDDAAAIAAVSFLDDAETRFAVTVERAALAALGGGCQVPIGVLCRTRRESSFETEEDWRRDDVWAMVTDPETGANVCVGHSEPREGSDPVVLGRLVAKKLLDKGAGPLLEARGEGSR